MKAAILIPALLLCPYQTNAQQVMPIDSITNTRTIVTYNNPLSNIVVTNNGNLTVNSMETITLCAPFEVLLGGQLNICITTPVPVIIEYDNSGNRIARKLDD